MSLCTLLQLSLEQQLNCICDSLAKAAVSQSLEPGAPANRNQRLPKESAAVYVRGVKQTSDVADDVRFALAMTEAERFYTAPLGVLRPNGTRDKSKGLGWSTGAFRAVD